MYGFNFKTGGKPEMNSWGINHKLPEQNLCQSIRDFSAYANAHAHCMMTLTSTG